MYFDHKKWCLKKKNLIQTLNIEYEIYDFISFIEPICLCKHVEQYESRWFIYIYIYIWESLIVKFIWMCYCYSMTDYFYVQCKIESC